MALVPYAPRKRLYGNAFDSAPAGPLFKRPRYTVMPGMARNGFYNNRRGGRYNRRGYSPFANRSMHTHPVYPRPEVKALDVAFGSLAAPISIPLGGTNSGAFTILNQITNGSGLQLRIGNQIAMKSVYYQYVLNFGTGPVPNAIRHMLVWDKQPNQAAALTGDVLASNQSTANTDYITVPMNLTNRDRFVILADERTTLSPNGDQIRFISGFRKINQRSDYPVTNLPSTGALLLCFFSDETVTANEPTVYGNWRLRYIDC